MIDLDLVDMEINRLEAEDVNYVNCAKLADLYSVRDHFHRYGGGYSYGQSEFLQACNMAPIETTLSIIDEHMNAINALYPKEYAAILKRIREAAI